MSCPLGWLQPRHISKGYGAIFLGMHWQTLVIYISVAPRSWSGDKVLEKPVATGPTPWQDHTAVASRLWPEDGTESRRVVRLQATNLQPLPYWLRLQKTCKAETKHQRGMRLLVWHLGRTAQLWPLGHSGREQKTGNHWPQCLSGWRAIVRSCVTQG